TTYAALTSAMAAGSVLGALASGARGRVSPHLLAGAAVAFGTLTLLAAGAPAFALQVAVLVPLGAASVTFAAGVNSSLQLAADPPRAGDRREADRQRRLTAGHGGADRRQGQHRRRRLPRRAGRQDARGHRDEAEQAVAVDELDLQRGHEPEQAAGGLGEEAEAR